jgi:hypothetical protein
MPLACTRCWLDGHPQGGFKDQYGSLPSKTGDASQRSFYSPLGEDNGLISLVTTVVFVREPGTLTSSILFSTSVGFFGKEG